MRQSVTFTILSAVFLPVLSLVSPSRASEGSVWLDAPGYEVTITGCEPLPSEASGGSPRVVEPGAGAAGSGLVFTSTDYRRLLVVPDAGADSYILHLTTKEVTIIPRSMVKVGEDGARLEPDARETPAGGYELDGADIRYAAPDSVCIDVGPQPDLVGEVTLDQILARKPGFRKMAAEYSPDAGAVEAIRSISAHAEILVFFGSWCPVCSRRLPLFLRIMEEAHNPNLRVRYIAIDEDYREPKDMIRAHRIHVTPAFIVLVDGIEIGRIEHKPEVSLEEDLARILKAVG